MAVPHRASTLSLPDPGSSPAGAAVRRPGAADQPSGWRHAIRDGLNAPLGRRLLQFGRVCASPREYVVRRALARKVLRQRVPAVHIDPDRGYVLLDGEGSAGSPFSRLDAVLEDCRREVREIRPDLAAIHAAGAGKFRLTIDLFHDDLLAQKPGFVDFMLQDDVLLPVVEYLGT